MKENDMSHVILGIIILIKRITSSNMFIQFINPIWAGLWNDVVDWGGALSARIQFLEGSPL